jgi:hypothetical protein
MATTGLFGSSPYELQQERQAQLATAADAYGRTNPNDPYGFDRARSGLYMAGSQLGGGIAGLMGVEDPQMKKAADIQSILKNFDPTTYEGLQGAAKALGEKGYAQEAVNIAAKAEEFKLKSAQAGYYTNRGEAAMKKAKEGGTGGIGKINPGLYTTASVQAYAESIDSGVPDYGLLDERDPKARAQALSPAGKRASEEGLVRGTPEFIARVKQINEMPSDKGAEGMAKTAASTSIASSGLDKTKDLLSKVGGDKPTVFFGPVSNFKGWAESTGFLGEPSDNTLAQDEVRAHLIEGINAVLNEAKGVQAKDDAARAKEQIQGMLKLNTNAGAAAALNRLKTAQENVIKSNVAYETARNPNAKKPTTTAPPAAGQTDYAAAFKRAQAADPKWANYTLEQFTAAAKAQGK